MQGLDYSQARDLFDSVISDKSLTRAQILATAIAMLSQQVKSEARDMFLGYLEGYLGIVLDPRGNAK